MRRYCRRCHRYQLITLGRRTHIVGGIEAVQRQQIYYLSVHHVLGAHDTPHLAIGVLSQCREFKVEAYVGLLHVARHFQQRMHGNICAVQILVLKERLVKVAEVGVYRIDRLNVKSGCKRVAVKRYRAARLYREILYYYILKREVIASLGERV